MSHSNVTLYSVKDLQDLFSLSRSSVYRIINRDEFPKAVVLGPTDKRNSASRWRSDEVQAYIETLPREKTFDV
jgi:predicted DNA-binding transcriptional regulator AlpA